MDRNYTVYVHIFPNGKRYFGITSKDPEKRWQKGYGYKKGNSIIVYSAIQKYGWDNIEHKILYNKLTKDEAQQIEIYLIKKYKTNCCKYGNDYGYNMTDGGEGTKGKVLSEESKKKISEAHKGKTGYLCCNSKQVICDGIEYASLTEFKKINNVTGAVNCWLNGKNGMPVEWYERGLHYKGQDVSIIYPQKKPSKNIILYNGKEYPSQQKIAEELKVSPALVCGWLKGTKKIPKNIKEKGFGYKNKANIKFEIKQEKHHPVIQYDNIIFYNQRRLAEYIGEKYATVNAWVKGKNPIPQKYLERGFKVIE